MPLPITGQLDWGIPLNDYITNSVLAVANQALTSINAHTSGIDPHGDRAFASGLVQPIVTGTNLPNGYVVLNSSGEITQGMLPPGVGQSSFFDVVHDHGATGNGSTDDYAAIQATLNDCTAAGGGEVWVPDGVFACGTQLVIGSGTWLHLSPGATIKRITPIAGSAPSVMVSNVNFALGNAVPTGGNILIQGGTWDAVGSGLTSNCTPILLVHANFSAVKEVFFNGVKGNPLIEINGTSFAVVRDCVFGGTPLAAGAGVIPAVRLNSTSVSTTPAGMLSSVYNNATCTNILVDGCSSVITSGSQPSTNRLVGTDFFQTPFNHNVVSVTSCSTSGGSFDAVPPVDFTHVLQGISYGNLWEVAAGNPTLDLTTTGNVFVGPSAPSGNPPLVYVAGQLLAATGYMGNYVPETWHIMTLTSGWAVGPDSLGVNYPPAYRLLPDGSVALRGTLQTPGSSPATDVAFTTLPGSYASTFTHPPAAPVVNLGGTQTGHVYLDASGKLYLNGGFNNSINVFLDGAILRRA